MVYTNNPVFYENDQTIIRFDRDGNLFNLSSLKEYDSSIASYGFAIKFVCEGTERYTVNQKRYDVSGGNYLLLNGEKEAKVIVDSTKSVKGLCINISNQTIADVISTLKSPSAAVADPELSDFFYTEHFLENQYHSPHTLLGRKLQEIGMHIQNSTFSNRHINKELFFELAENLVADQLQVFKQLQSIPSVKLQTKRDLCRRILQGKEFIDSNFTQALTIDQIARAAGMSEYHFFRLFKQTIGLSPYQYILSCRLNNSVKLLKTDHSVSDVAIAMGFSDIYAFSKAFKKHFGVSPKGYAEQK